MTQHTFQPIPSATLQEAGTSELPNSQQEVIGLWVDYPTGRSSFLTFDREFDRGLFMIGYRDQPVALRPVTYREAA